LNENASSTADQWLAEHGTVLYRYALMHLRDSHRAEEVVQETLLAALQARFSGDASVRTWLFGILKHKIIDQFRRDAREAPLDQPQAVADPDAGDEDNFTEAGHWRNRPASWGNPEQMLESCQFWQILQRCLDYLPERHARLFMLREVMENSTEEICQELNITPTNLWTLLHRARLALRQCLEKHGVAGIKGER
jgi:RNA polymerase sigma-70 factor (ECF subfamily)